MFNSMHIRVGFQLEPQLMFCCMVVGIKPGFMAMFLFVAPPKGLFPKVDSVVARLHYYSMLANSSSSKCPVNSTTHKFPRLTLSASWYFSTFDLSYLNLRKKKLFQSYVVAQQSCNRCSIVGAK
jgi:hypothetical protein